MALPQNYQTPRLAASNCLRTAALTAASRRLPPRCPKTLNCCSNAQNMGDAASRTGAAAGRQLEAAGQKVGSQKLQEEGRGLQAKGH